MYSHVYLSIANEIVIIKLASLANVSCTAGMEEEKQKIDFDFNMIVFK